MAKYGKESAYPSQRRQIDTDIKTGAFRPCYLIYGEEDYLRMQVKNNLKNALLEGADAMNLLRVKGESADAAELTGFAETMPFFAQRRVVLVEDSGFFKNGDETLTQYFQTPPETCVFVFVETQVDKRSALYKAVMKFGREVSCDVQTPQTLRKWVAWRLKKEGKSFTESTLDDFVARMGSNMFHIDAELDKLISYTAGRQEIAKKDVDAICAGWLEGKVFDLTDAISERDRVAAMRHYATMVEMEEPPNRILAMIERQFNLMLQVAELQRRHAGMDAMERATGLKSFMVSKYLRWSRRFTEAELRAFLELCLSNERAMKRSRLDKTIAVEMVIARCTA